MISKNTRLIKLLLALGLMGLLHCMLQGSVSVEHMFKEAKRVEDLQEYESAEKHYIRVKNAKPAFSGSPLLNDVRFLRIVQSIKDKAEVDELGGISVSDLQELELIVEQSENQLISSDKHQGMLEFFKEFKNGYLNQYMYHVQGIIEKRYLVPKNTESHALKSIDVLEKTLKLYELSDNVRKKCKKYLRYFRDTIQKEASKKRCKEKEIHKILERIGTIEGSVAYLELFRTLPRVQEDKTAEFKYRVFRMHLINNVEAFGEYWCILFGNATEYALMEQTADL
ncbi:uncharacterized protein NEMAJ01_0984 [Nematocida major]|uniref:uncharacterized protein n=1 Tax=Nematocida major TaxID=1912982 RepID=UPI0020076A2F|nr:uncharacterized protein NEMAJ01_0984 [Nematocida major]KAH9386088.1 hypothetical protein NEMAJ01_0984 [Nematocida major]